MNKFKVPIKNALFMYSYIWDKVYTNIFTELSSDDAFNSSNIYVELFLINIKKVLSKGLYKEYVSNNEKLNIVRGKIDFINTINQQSLLNGQIYCDYDELVENNIYNQIIKSIAIRLSRTSDISKENKTRLNKVILYFNQVDYIELKKDYFKTITFNRNNSYYFMMIKICELIFNAQMLSEKTGKYVFYDLFSSDENMNNVFELFVNKFYQHELEKKYKVKYQSLLNWDLSGGNLDLLPIMKLDTLILSSDETIIIDTKYYKNYLVDNGFNKKELRSGHLYQMMSYMNNIKCNNKLRGILLYPLPFDENDIYESYDVNVVSGSIVKEAKIEFVTIDLSDDWRNIKNKLLKIILKD